MQRRTCGALDVDTGAVQVWLHEFFNFEEKLDDLLQRRSVEIYCLQGESKFEAFVKTHKPQKIALRLRQKKKKSQLYFPCAPLWREVFGKKR